MASIPLSVLATHFSNTTITCDFPDSGSLRCVFADPAFAAIIGPLDSRAREDTAKALFAELLDARAARLVWLSLEDGLGIMRATSFTAAVLGLAAWGVCKVVMTRSRSARRSVARWKGYVWRMVIVSGVERRPSLPCH